jgi:hypothetical protein
MENLETRATLDTRPKITNQKTRTTNCRPTLTYYHDSEPTSLCTLLVNYDCLISGEAAITNSIDWFDPINKTFTGLESYE